MKLSKWFRRIFQRLGLVKTESLPSCPDCGKLSPGYDIHGDVLRMAKARYPTRVECVCLPCIERRLGRYLCIEDFAFFSPVNDPIFFAYRMGAEEAVEETRRGRKRIKTHSLGVRMSTVKDIYDKGSGQ